eukprot:6928317-Pyramimonas_sp.AAC.1
MSDNDFEVCKSLLGPSQTARVMPRRALGAGDPRAVSKDAQAELDDLKRQVTSAAKKVDKVQTDMHARVLELVQPKAQLASPQEQERAASAKASTAWAQIATGSFVVDSEGQAVSPDDPAFVLLMQFQSLDGDLARSLRELLVARP